MKQFLKIIPFIMGIYSADAKLSIGGEFVTSTNAHYLTYVRHITVPVASQNGATWDAGNDVTGKTEAEIQAIVTAIKALETDERLKEIHARMVAVENEIFIFTDVAHVKATVLQRLETIRMMQYFNSEDSPYTYARPHEGLPAMTTAALWEKGKRSGFLYRQKGNNAYNAIMQLCDAQTVTRGECYGAAVACIWYGAARAMGEVKFNQLYPEPNVLNMDTKWPGNDSTRRNTYQATNHGEAFHIPGDWMYIKNHNYDEVVKVTEFYDKGWLLPEEKATYYWQGENAFYFGTGSYEGLGAENKTAEQMRNDMRIFYNNDLAQVIANGGKVNGVVVTDILLDDVEEKIIWSNVKRLKH